MGRILVRLEGSRTGTRTCRGCRQLGIRPRRGSGGGQRTEDGRTDHPSGDHRPGDSRDSYDSLDWRQAALTSFLMWMACMMARRLASEDRELAPIATQSGGLNLSEALQPGASGNGVQDQNASGTLVSRGSPGHGVAYRLDVAVGDRDHAPTGAAEGRAQGSGLLGGRDRVVEIGVGAGTPRLMQPVVHRAPQQ